MAAVSIIHVLIAILLVIVVLVQDSKGGGMGGAFGGGGGNANSVLGATGTASFMVKATRFVVILFAITSLFLTHQSSGKKKSALDSAGATPTEMQQKALPATTETTTPVEGTGTTAPAASQSPATATAPTGATDSNQKTDKK
jgi:preprotein translocase subunit SecG